MTKTKKRIPVEPARYYFDDDQVYEEISLTSSDFEAIKAQSEAIKTSTVESTRRMLKYCHEADQAGVKTLDMLADQGEQLNHIGIHIQEIDENLNIARRNLTEMDRNYWFDAPRYLPSLFCCCCASKSTSESENPEVPENDSSESKGWIQSRMAQVTTVFTLQPKSSSLRTEADPGPPRALDGPKDAEDELTENLTDVNYFLGGLRSMALDMGSEINRQNTQLDELNVKALRNDAKMAKAKTSIAKLNGE